MYRIALEYQIFVFLILLHILYNVRALRSYKRGDNVVCRYKQRSAHYNYQGFTYQTSQNLLFLSTIILLYIILVLKNASLIAVNDLFRVVFLISRLYLYLFLSIYQVYYRIDETLSKSIKSSKDLLVSLLGLQTTIFLSSK